MKKIHWPSIFLQAQILSCVSVSHPYFTDVQGINTGRKPGEEKKSKEGGKKTRHHYGKCWNENTHKLLNEAYRPLP